MRLLSFVIDDGIDCGNVIRGAIAGIYVGASRTRSRTGGVTFAICGGHKAASYAEMGANIQRVDISLVASSIYLFGPGAPMRVRNFVIGGIPTAILTTTPIRFRTNAASGVFQFPGGCDA